MGMLVTGAQKMEEGVERLKTNLREITQETKSRAEPGLRTAWKEARRTIDEKGSNLRPVRRRVMDLRVQLTRRTRLSIDKAEARTRVVLTRIVENAIAELEKAKRKLERDSDRMWHAA